MGTTVFCFVCLGASLVIFLLNKLIQNSPNFLLFLCALAAIIAGVGIIGSSIVCVEPIFISADVLLKVGFVGLFAVFYLLSFQK